MPVGFAEAGGELRVLAVPLPVAATRDVVEARAVDSVCSAMGVDFVSASSSSVDETATQMDLAARRYEKWAAGDRIRLVVGLVVLSIGLFLAVVAQNTIGGAEADLVGWFNRLPDRTIGLVVGTGQLIVVAVPLVVWVAVVVASSVPLVGHADLGDERRLLDADVHRVAICRSAGRDRGCPRSHSRVVCRCWISDVVGDRGVSGVRHGVGAVAQSTVASGHVDDVDHAGAVAHRLLGGASARHRRRGGLGVGDRLAGAAALRVAAADVSCERTVGGAAWSWCASDRDGSSGHRRLDAEVSVRDRGRSAES